MTKPIAFIAGICLVLVSVNSAWAHDRDELEALVVGGIGGAAIGHVISGTPEGVIIGSFLGSTIGLLATADHDRNHVVVIRNRHHRRWPGYTRWGYRYHRSDRRSWNDNYRNRWDRHSGRHHR